MKTIFLVMLLSAVNTFAAPTDVCVIGVSKEATELVKSLGVSAGGCLTPAETTTRLFRDSVVANCSVRADNVYGTYAQIAWVQAGPDVPSSCVAPNLAYKYVYKNVDSVEQAKADVIARLYQKGYVLFDNVTLLRTR